MTKPSAEQIAARITTLDGIIQQDYENDYDGALDYVVNRCAEAEVELELLRAQVKMDAASRRLQADADRHDREVRDSLREEIRRLREELGQEQGEEQRGSKCGPDCGFCGACS